jgi:CheY-like chemotaxis protein
VNNEIGSKLRVLIVEDEPIAREILGDLLRMAGYDVLADHSGEQALLTLRRERGRIDCLFTAVELPGLIDGWMLADEFRTLDADAPIVLAARSEPANTRLLQDAAFVARPLLPPKAVEAIKQLTGRRGTAGGLRALQRQVGAEAAVSLLVETPPAPEALPPAEPGNPLRRTA